IGARITDWSYTMNDTYTLKEAMERLGLQSANVFFRLEREYPEAFVVMKGTGKNANSRLGVAYDKATLDRFAERGEYFKQEQP
ncbi:MAG TPA: hypothetical protein VFM05_11145, partial [Candidatus Saccharimonadales bacterium]|nr:hypothetical protein [Candidatus Saccharimonadales bacterium]